MRVTLMSPGEEGGRIDSLVFHTALRLLDGSLSDAEFDDFCSLLAYDRLVRQSYLSCVQTIVGLQLHAPKIGR